MIGVTGIQRNEGNRLGHVQQDDSSLPVTLGVAWGPCLFKIGSWSIRWRLLHSINHRHQPLGLGEGDDGFFGSSGCGLY